MRRRDTQLSRGLEKQVGRAGDLPPVFMQSRPWCSRGSGASAGLSKPNAARLWVNIQG